MYISETAPLAFHFQLVLDLHLAILRLVLCYYIRKLSLELAEFRGRCSLVTRVLSLSYWPNKLNTISWIFLARDLFKKMSRGGDWDRVDRD